MTTPTQIQQQLDEIKARNQRVEADKAWETSWTRRLIILIFTYIVIVIFFLIVRLPKPFVNAVVPSVAFILSTMTVPLFKKWWLKNIKK
ncbi:MAG: hypothetical protein COU31_03225 [Candidatus Magasanikbacteria bacterium CG10_big_fil_rev_8_21_14_0_10_40_10]|uniref:Uncharacterized protein n=1 Tax=Candidatus Magasanikbacteria bacterium CG10_big_fil_rev_8_21_14_0_10_40_10 TaxID=1974648 RepID=A0A2M6W3T0_9BACT|nr:MAG: hypothetical protein COU31_03225 [Candidatus Magasanikbacteria bacterium CG10_big_fil_rev_8_21_14_0_10_40_10]